MSPLRQEAFRLMASVPEEKLYAVIQLITSEEFPSAHANDINLNKYSGRGGNMFGSVEAVENYIKDLRSDGK